MQILWKYGGFGIKYNRQKRMGLFNVKNMHLKVDFPRFMLRVVRRYMYIVHLVFKSHKGKNVFDILHTENVQFDRVVSHPKKVTQP